MLTTLMNHCTFHGYLLDGEGYFFHKGGVGMSTMVVVDGLLSWLLFKSPDEIFSRLEV
jgi:hypothetical protein